MEQKAVTSIMKKNTTTTFKKARVLFSSNVKQAADEEKKMPPPQLIAVPNEKDVTMDPIQVTKQEETPQEKMFANVTEEKTEIAVEQEDISSQILENQKDISFEVSTISELDSPPLKASEIQPNSANSVALTKNILEQHTVVRYDQ